MKRLSALVAMSAMAISLLAPSMVRANRNEVRYYPSGQTVRYYPSAQAGGCVSGVNTNTMTSGRVQYVPTGSVQYVPTNTRFVESGMAGSRVYFISDNPRYDLSGADETVFLVEDGSAYRTNRGRTPVAYVTALGTIPTPQVVAVPSEYRQDWLAVAAGDRPVRCIPAAGTMVTPSSYTMAPRAVTYTSTAPYHNNRYSYTTTTTRYGGTQYRHVSKPRTHKVYRRTTYSNASRSYTVRRKTRATTASYYRPARTRVVTRTYTPVAADCASMMNTAAVAVAAQPMAMHDLYQIGNTWYMESNGEWSRSDSWRGPFFRVKKGHVPREVRESAKKSHSFESDDD